MSCPKHRLQEQQAQRPVLAQYRVGESAPDGRTAVTQLWDNGEYRLLGIFVSRHDAILATQPRHQRCPECQSVLMHESGCATCPSCAWSKCG